MHGSVNLSSLDGFHSIISDVDIMGAYNVNIFKQNPKKKKLSVIKTDREMSRHRPTLRGISYSLPVLPNCALLTRCLTTLSTSYMAP